MRAKALEDLHKEAKTQKQTEHFLPFKELAAQKYMTTLTPKYARKIFHIRTNTINLRGVRKYMYGENTSCRLCPGGTETVDHVVNYCAEISHPQYISVFTTDIDELREIARRCIDFDDKLDNENTGS